MMKRIKNNYSHNYYDIEKYDTDVLKTCEFALAEFQNFKSCRFTVADLQI